MFLLSSSAIQNKPLQHGHDASENPWNNKNIINIHHRWNKIPEWNIEMKLNKNWKFFQKICRQVNNITSQHILFRICCALFSNWPVHWDVVYERWCADISQKLWTWFSHSHHGGVNLPVVSLCRPLFTRKSMMRVSSTRGVVFFDLIIST